MSLGILAAELADDEFIRRFVGRAVALEYTSTGEAGVDEGIGAGTARTRRSCGKATRCPKHHPAGISDRGCWGPL